MTNGEGWGIEDNDIMGGYLPQEKTRVPRNCAGEIPKIRTSDGNCAELRDEGTVFFYVAEEMSTRWHRGGEDATQEDQDKGEEEGV